MTKFMKSLGRENVYGVKLTFPCGAKFDTVNSRSNIKDRLHIKICKFCSVNCQNVKNNKTVYFEIDAMTGEETEIKN